ncbi:MAG: hypothetical protein KBD53_00755 [Candidatus Omnitrophica bacterium]|nr:hypothetical protein [Candidatus Omnitrophota bacterium]
MSRSTKLGYIALIIINIGVIGFLGYTLCEMKKVSDTKISVEKELKSAEEREKKYVEQAKKASTEVETLKSSKIDLEKKLSLAQKKSIGLQLRINDVTKKSNKWKTQVASISQTRDQLNSQVKTLQDQVNTTKQKLEQQLTLTRENINSGLVSSGQSSKAREVSPGVIEITPDPFDESVHPVSDEMYWASVLKEKASLEVKIQQMEEALAKGSIEIVELKQSNDSIKLELESLRNASDDLAQEIKYKSNMINNLSLELARTKNDKKFVSDRMIKIQEENSNLRGEMKQLVSAKGSLQKSIVRLTQDKNKVERELGSSENLIQSKIDEIWEIKDSLDRSFKESAINLQNPGSVELPPIMVSSNNDTTIDFNSDGAEPGFHGRIVSINEENNFVVVDIGEGSGIALGDALSVYRDSEYVARLEVIQVRKDISAADIKDQWSKVQVGDEIR